MKIEVDDEIRALQRRMKAAAAELRSAEQALRAAVAARSPFQPGDEVEALLRGRWVRARIAKLSDWNALHDEPSVEFMVNLLNRAGGWSAQAVHAFGDVRPVGSGR